jgi:hypothetical protein
MILLNVGKNLTERFFRNFLQLTGQDPSPPILVCCDTLEEWTDTLERCVVDGDMRREAYIFLRRRKEEKLLFGGAPFLRLSDWQPGR